MRFCLKNNIILFHIFGILQTKVFFNKFIAIRKGWYHLLDGSDNQTKSAMGERDRDREREGEQIGHLTCKDATFYEV